MTRELSPLEAFNKIKNDSYKTYEEECACYEVVETALKRSEQIDKLPKTEFYTTNKIELNDELDEKVKALEIIKEKRVNVDYFIERIKKDTDYKEYKRLCGLYKITIFSRKYLTKEEYDLLKEVLL